MANSIDQVRDISVLQWNCRSLIPKIDSFKHLLCTLSCDIFALSETWLSSETDLHFPQYNIIRLDRDDSYGGVLLGIGKSHSFYRINLPPLNGIEAVACEVNVKGKSLCIVSMYMPPRIVINNKQLSDLCSALPGPLLLLGDFNSHGTAWGAQSDDTRSKLIIDMCDSFDMTILNTGEITRIAKPPSLGSAIDLSLCSNSLSLDCSWKVIQDPQGSDHLPIKISIKNEIQSQQKVNITYDLTKHIDWEKFADAMEEAMYSVGDLPPEEEYNFLSHCIINSARQAQTKPIPTTFHRRPSSPWWDIQCSKLFAEKSKAFKTFRKRGSIENFDKYQSLERQFKNLIKGKKRGYWRHFVEGLSRETSMTTLWKVAKNMRNHVSSNESEEYSHRWIFNFARKVCPDSVPMEKIIRHVSIERGTLDSAFTMVELSIALLCCNNTAPGIDGIKFSLLKNLPISAKKRLLNMFNQFLEQNIVPHDWRQVRVIAIQKPGKPASDFNSYRPIAMLSCIRKLMEKMILLRLDKWVEENGLLSETQFGFRRGRGTNDCLALLSSEIQLAYAQKNQMASVFLDIKGAFDSVSIEILSNKLHSRGLPPLLNNILYNLLSEKQLNFSCGNLSVNRTSFMGLPQGSCLSPLLYNFYVSDIDRCLTGNCTLRQLADDGVVSVVGSRAADLQGPLQDTLDNLTMWATQLGIEFSSEKTEYVVFSKKHNPAQLHLQLSGKSITHSMSFKYLGVWFDSKGTWGKHIRYLKQKCDQRTNFLRSITGTWWGAHPQDLIKLYQSTILSVLEYGSFCFLSAANTHLITLERIQYRCLRLALGCMNSTHTMSLEVLAGVLPLKDRFSMLALRFLIRCEIINPLVIANFENLLEINPQTRFMLIYYVHITQEISLSSFNPGYVSHYNYTYVHFDLSMRQDIEGIPTHLRSSIIPSIFSAKYAHINPDRMYFTDGSSLNECTGFGVFSEVIEAFYSLQKPCSVYVAELAAICCALSSIALQPVSHYFIFTDSLSSVEAIRSMKQIKHSSYFLWKIRELLSVLSSRCYDITFVWVPSHCSIPGNEKADSLAKVGALEGELYERQITFNEYYYLARQNALASWQRKWSEGELGRWLHSIIPTVTTKPWFKGMDVNRNFIKDMSRLMSNHYSLDAHLHRIGLTSSNVCECKQGYHDIEHVVWSCEKYQTARQQFQNTLQNCGKQPDIPVREILASRDLEYMQLLHVFLKSIDIFV